MNLFSRGNMHVLVDLPDFGVPRCVMFDRFVLPLPRNFSVGCFLATLTPYYKIFSDSAGSFGLFQKFRGFIILGTASRNIAVIKLFGERALLGQASLPFRLAETNAISELPSCLALLLYLPACLPGCLPSFLPSFRFACLSNRLPRAVQVRLSCLSF